MPQHIPLSARHTLPARCCPNCRSPEPAKGPNRNPPPHPMRSKQGKPRQSLQVDDSSRSPAKLNAEWLDPDGCPASARLIAGRVHSIGARNRDPASGMCQRPRSEPHVPIEITEGAPTVAICGSQSPSMTLHMIIIYMGYFIVCHEELASVQPLHEWHWPDPARQDKGKCTSGLATAPAIARRNLRRLSCPGGLALFSRQRHSMRWAWHPKPGMQSRGNRCGQPHPRPRRHEYPRDRRRQKHQPGHARRDDPRHIAETRIDRRHLRPLRRLHRHQERQAPRHVQQHQRHGSDKQQRHRRPGQTRPAVRQP